MKTRQELEVERENLFVRFKSTSSDEQKIMILTTIQALDWVLGVQE